MGFSFFQTDKNKATVPTILKAFKDEEKDWLEFFQKSSSIEADEACLVGDENNAALYFLPCAGEVQLLEKSNGKWEKTSDITHLCVLPLSGSTTPEKAMRSLLFSYMQEKAHYLYPSIPFTLVLIICQRVAAGKTTAEAIEDVKNNPQFKSKLRPFLDLEPNSDESQNQIKDDALVLIQGKSQWKSSAQTERQKIEDRIELLHSILVNLEVAPQKLKEIVEYLDNPANSESATKQIKIFNILTGGK